MKLDHLLWTQPAIEVLYLLRELAAYPPAYDPWPNAWPYASAMHAPTTHLPLYERKEQ